MTRRFRAGRSRRSAGTQSAKRGRQIHERLRRTTLLNSCLPALFPRARMAATVQYRYDDDAMIVNLVKDAKRKAANESTSNGFVNRGERVGLTGNRVYGGLHLVNELPSKAGFICLVPQSCLGHVLFCFGPETNLYRHRRRRTSANASAAVRP